LERSFVAMARLAAASGTRALTKTRKPAVAKHTPPPGAGAWLPGVVMGATGAKRSRLYRPPGAKFGERLPLMVMLHGCGQDANSFAANTRMNRIAMRERFLVLYPEQDRLANAESCWNCFDTVSDRAQSDVALIMKATLVAVDRLAHAWSGGAASKPFSDVQGPDAARNPGKVVLRLS
jgi:poly(3-hydroxybutyrate) depolymerase